MSTYRQDWPAKTITSTFNGWSPAGTSPSGDTIWSPVFNYGYQTFNFDGLAEAIPQGAEILDVNFVMNTAAQKQLQSDGKYYALASNAIIKQALNEGKRNLRIYCSWRGSAENRTRRNPPPPLDSQHCAIGASYVEITYDGGDGAVTVIRYGIGGEWVDCDAYVGRDGKYVPFEMHYPDNGGWHKIEQRILDE